MSKKCEWLHKQLENLPMIYYPFDINKLPFNGIYFLYEKGETWGHSGEKLRIVRVGTHRGNNNFQSRISEHLLIDIRVMDFDREQMKPSDRSIFRKNIGRALLKQDNDSYLEIWNKDFIKSEDKRLFHNRRIIKKEKQIENKITRIIRNNFSFRFIVVESKDMRKKLESCIIGTLAKCEQCESSDNWLGRYSPVKSIQESGLWLRQHLNAEEINEKDNKNIEDAIRKTREWLNSLKSG